MTNRMSEEDDSNNDTDNSQIADENAVPGTHINKDNQYDIAMERNRFRWEYQEMYEKAAIEMYINEDVATKQRKSIHQAVNMSQIVLNVQEALHSGVKHDLLKATENLKKLLKEPFTTMSLLYAPNVVKTVYLCCRYENNAVRAIAKHCYSRFEPCFGVPAGETFETTFQAEVREFWKQQKAVIYDSSKYNWAHFTMCDDDDDTCIEAKNSIKEDDAEKMEIEELKSIKNEMKVKIESIKIKCEPDDKNAIKKEVKNELLDDKSLIKKEISVKTESADDKNLIKKEITKMKVECKTDINDEPFDDKSTIKEEIMDTDDIEITYSSIAKKEIISSLPKLSVKLEPIDLEKLNAEYDSDEDCYILN